MDLDTTRTWITIIGGVVAAAATILAMFKALAEWRRSTQQRREELNLHQREFRHKQAIFARDLISEVFADPKSRAALNMLDWKSFKYKDESGITHTIEEEDIQKKMNSTADADAKEVFIRTRFEALYDYLEQIEHLISLGIVNFADFEVPFRYYMVELLTPAIQHLEFLDNFDYKGVKGFALRCKESRVRNG